LPGSRDCQHSGCGLGHYVKSGRALTPERIVARSKAFRNLRRRMLANPHVMSRLIWTDSLGRSPVEPEAWCGLYVFARLSRIPDGAAGLDQASRISTSSISTSSISTSWISTSWISWDLRETFKGACAGQARELSGRTQQRCGGLRGLPGELMAVVFRLE
jgi:hypothetical protein